MTKFRNITVDGLPRYKLCKLMLIETGRIRVRGINDRTGAITVINCYNLLLL